MYPALPQRKVARMFRHSGNISLKSIHCIVKYSRNILVNRKLANKTSTAHRLTYYLFELDKLSILQADLVCSHLNIIYLKLNWCSTLFEQRLGKTAGIAPDPLLFTQVSRSPCGNLSHRTKDVASFRG